jgi:DNA-binding SARP family transcriptional activator
MLLLAAANRPVRADELVDGVWDGRPSPTAASNLRVLVWRWRKVLPVAATGGDRIARTPGAYRVVVARDELDAFLFEDLAEAAHRAARDGDHLRAERDFRAALQLWRDEAYPGIAVAASTALEERRRLAVDGLVTALFAQDRSGDAIPLLRGLTAACPYDERSWERLMIALSRYGRRGEALAVYRQAQTVLARDLGVHPARRLQTLRQDLEAADR